MTQAFSDHHEAPTLELELEPAPEAPAVARAALAEFSETHGIDADTRATVLLLVSELVTNAVVHPDVQPPDDIGMHVRMTELVIRVEITDQGSGFTPAPRNPAQIDGGYGLYLLSQAASRWGVESGDGTTVWFEVPAQAG
ncbi:MAG: ATP-binding protein [Solirubrobacteraceae bacterium]